MHAEPQITHSAEPTTDLRSTIQAVLERHQPEPNEWNIFGLKSAEFICSHCRTLSHPCDAYQMATALLEAVTALECGRRYAETVVSQSELFGMMSDIGIDAAYSIQEIDNALTTIAAKLKEADDA